MKEPTKEALELMEWEDKNSLEGLCHGSFHDFGKPQSDWASRRIDEKNVSIAADKMVKTLKVPTYLIMLARKTLSAGNDGQFDLAKAKEIGDLRPVSGAHTCEAGRNVMDFIEQKPSCTFSCLEPKLKAVPFRVIFVDDKVIHFCHMKHLPNQLIGPFHLSTFFVVFVLRHILYIYKIRPC